MTEENENITAEEDLQQDQPVSEESAQPQNEDILEDESDDDLEIAEKRPEPAPLPETLKTDEGHEVTLESVVEAVLFASDEPITPNRLVNILEVGSVKQIRESVEHLNEKYKQGYRFDIDFVVNNKPTKTHCEQELFKLT